MGVHGPSRVAPPSFNQKCRSQLRPRLRPGTLPAFLREIGRTTGTLLYLLLTSARSCPVRPGALPAGHPAGGGQAEGVRAVRPVRALDAAAERMDGGVGGA